ncbi:hypothetical protein JHK85_022450 [Glycine max]|uniref:Uncharacterized protein n=1 Tax=Glycine max TaxID=3847 RepID=A0A0R0IQF7_SOYBN|nr:hypothetical protein JHK87_021908 [Glycine soja]KAG5016314.1 hypothetical protein JHK85_022450 [Glycine max]KAG5026083.1 hypothetical protein JHK86_021997 [Glycine max]KAH1052309.1 hypothetical protein GYH30_021917 [Glycine max]
MINEAKWVPFVNTKVCINEIHHINEIIKEAADARTIKTHFLLPCIISLQVLAYLIMDQAKASIGSIHFLRSMSSEARIAEFTALT